MDLRASFWKGRPGGGPGIERAAWDRGVGVEVDVDVNGPRAVLTEEATAVATDRAGSRHQRFEAPGASRIRVVLHTGERRLFPAIVDNGSGFEQHGAFSSQDGISD